MQHAWWQRCGCAASSLSHILSRMSWRVQCVRGSVYLCYDSWCHMRGVLAEGFPLATAQTQPEHMVPFTAYCPVFPVVCGSGGEGDTLQPPLPSILSRARLSLSLLVFLACANKTSLCYGSLLTVGGGGACGAWRAGCPLPVAVCRCVNQMCASLLSLQHSRGGDLVPQHEGSAAPKYSLLLFILRVC